MSQNKRTFLNTCKLHLNCCMTLIFGKNLGATSIVKIGEVRLSDEIGGGGLKISKKRNFIITIRYEILTFSSVGPFFEEGGRGSRKFRPEAEILVIFFN